MRLARNVGPPCFRDSIGVASITREPVVELTRSLRGLLVAGLMLGLGAGVLVASALAVTDTRGAPAAAAVAVKEGRTLTIGVQDFDFIDPALGQPPGTSSNLTFATWPAEDATCSLLLRYQVGISPTTRYRLVPDVATAYPAVSHDGKTWTFTIRKGYRFSSGAPVTAANYAAEINRVLNPRMSSPGAQFLHDVVGADAVLAGKARKALGVKAVGNRLIVRLTKRASDFAARMTMPYFCPVPRDLPAEPEGVQAPLPGSGPFYFAEFVRGSRVVLQRNRFYHGSRAPHLDQIVIQLGEGSDTVVKKIEAGERDVSMQVPIAVVDQIAATYGVNKRQYFSFPAPMMFYVVMNTSRPLFRDNPKLRQAVSFALDRPALRNVVGRSTGAVTDDYLPRIMPGYRAGHVYPLGQPDLEKAGALAQGRTRSGHAVLATCNTRGFGCADQAAIVKENLAKIGIDVEIRLFPIDVVSAMTATKGAAYDLTMLRHDAAYLDPAQFVNTPLDGRTIRPTGNTNRAYFDSERYNRLIDQAGRLTGQARFDAYGKLAVDLARDAAPLAAFAIRNWRFFVSSRVGCVRPAAQGGLDLASLCFR
jgi:ABC-type transport system substrate-binding protein